MRLPPIPPEDMSDEQRRVAAAIAAGPRGRVPAPLMAWLRSPVLAERAQLLGEFSRYGTSLPARLSELAIMVSAAVWSADHEWTAHEPHALRAGLDAGVLAEIKAGRRPAFACSDEAAVYDFATRLYAERRVPDAVYACALDELGERGVVELVGILGYYALISMTLKAFEI